MIYTSLNELKQAKVDNLQELTKSEDKFYQEWTSERGLERKQVSYERSLYDLVKHRVIFHKRQHDMDKTVRRIVNRRLNVGLSQSAYEKLLKECGLELEQVDVEIEKYFSDLREKMGW